MRKKKSLIYPNGKNHINHHTYRRIISFHQPGNIVQWETGIKTQKSLICFFHDTQYDFQSFSGWSLLCPHHTGVFCRLSGTHLSVRLKIRIVTYSGHVNVCFKASCDVFSALFHTVLMP